MIAILYAAVILTATFLGACAGLGGGVIIKPSLDAIAAHGPEDISFLSTAVVFTMSVYALTRQLASKAAFDYTMIAFVSAGSLVGGIVGERLFALLFARLSADAGTAVQSILLAATLVFVLLYVNGKHRGYRVQNRAVYCAVGLFLGAISSFLGIGGGPINVALFSLFFSAPIKQAVVYSIATIFFSQGAKLVFLAATTGFGGYDLGLLYYALPTALVGSFFGTMVNRRFGADVIARIFNVAVGATLVLTLTNIARALW